MRLNKIKPTAKNSVFSQPDDNEKANIVNNSPNLKGFQEFINEQRASTQKEIDDAEEQLAGLKKTYRNISQLILLIEQEKPGD